MINKFNNLYWNIRDFFFPQQRWLTKHIPNHWCDKIELIKIVAFESIVHFVEEERAFESNDWYHDEKHEEAWKGISRAYDLIKNIIPELQKEEKALWNCPPMKELLDEFVKTLSLKNQTIVQISIIKQSNEKNALISAYTQEAIELAAKYRQYMWT